MNASDLHLTVGLAPTIRCNGKLIQLGIDKLSSNDLERFLGKYFKKNMMNI